MLREDTKQMMSDSKFFESYSRYIDSEERYERWEESVKRVMDMHRLKYKDLMTFELAELIIEAEDAYNEKLLLGAQRALQFGGEQLLKHQIRMYNCVSSHADRPEYFGEFSYMLLCGAGAGFSVQTHHVAKLPAVAPRTRQTKKFTVPDSIEGWSEAFDVLMSSFFVGGGKHPEYEGRQIYFDLTEIREKGSMISGGFKAPGPEPLRRGLDLVERLLKRIAEDEGGVLRPIHVYDVCMFIADVVISGGVRRAATICLFSKGDVEMMRAKTGDWLITNPQRARSNNSVVLLRDETSFEEYSEMIEFAKQFGEPAVIWTDNLEFTFNPCVEIGKLPVTIDGVSGWQGCNLTEGNGAKCTTEEIFYKICRASAIIGTLQAGYTDFKFLGPASKEIFEGEALIGCSFTGWMSNPQIMFDEVILTKGANIIKEVNALVSGMIGINPAARTTCAKPAGNASVILMTPSGIHGEHAPTYLRSVTMSKNSEVAQLIKETNPAMVEQSLWHEENYMISFPVVSPETSLYKHELLGVKQLEYVKKAQDVWVEEGTNIDLCRDKNLRHNISNTITVDNWDDVIQYVYDHRSSFCGVSFIGEYGEKEYVQSPFTTILDEKELVDKHGSGAMFASGLIVDGLAAFDGNLWTACNSCWSMGIPEEEQTVAQKDWVRRFGNFRWNYFEGHAESAQYCLKDVYNLHKWEKILHAFKPVDFVKELHTKRYTDADTMGAIACSADENGNMVCEL